MTGDIVNLRRARKAKARAARAKSAAEKRVAFGRSKRDKALTEAERERAAKTIESHRRDPHRSE